jgi:hypothetical protein
MNNEHIEQEFLRLVAEWDAGTKYQSSPGPVFRHPAYGQILGLGPTVVPLILKMMEGRGLGVKWFRVLSELTGANPYTPEPLEASGWVAFNVPAGNRAWLEWGRQNGYLGAAEVS